MIPTLIYYLAMKAQKSRLDIQDAVGSDGVHKNILWRSPARSSRFKQVVTILTTLPKITPSVTFKHATGKLRLFAMPLSRLLKLMSEPQQSGFLQSRRLKLQADR